MEVGVIQVTGQAEAYFGHPAVCADIPELCPGRVDQGAVHPFPQFRQEQVGVLLDLGFLLPLVGPDEDAA